MLFGNGFEDVNSVTASEGIFARSVGVIYILRHDGGGEESVMARGRVLLAYRSEERRGSGGTKGNALYCTREQ